MSHFDDCGALYHAIPTNLIRALFLPGITVATDSEPQWSTSTSDLGTFDDVRRIIVEQLLLWKTIRFEFLDFPRKQFASSTFNTMRILHLLGEKLAVPPHLRCRLIQACLLLMFWTGSYVSSMEIPEDEYELGFIALTETLDSNRGALETDCFILPLAVHYFFGMPDSILNETDKTVFVNLLTTAEWFAQSRAGKVGLLCLARLCQIEKCQALMTRPCNSSRVLETSHAGSWGAVLVEIGLKIGEALRTAKVCRVLAIVLGMRIPQTPDICGWSWRALFRLMGEVFDDESCQITVRAVHWALGRLNALALAEAVLTHLNVFQTVHRKNPEFAECAEILEWAKRQTEKLMSIQATFTTEELGAALQGENSMVAMYDVPDEPPMIAFDIKAYYHEIFWILTDHYFRTYAGHAMPDLYVKDG
jgi:hypothetical protein